ncbi:MAG: lytic transglycosylase domain-containing protein [Candidatus Aminicenantes bacterium]|nr:lytic transglycosylase domain-containing protein [Candidatus Aminicenantes bacterium]
MKIKTVLILGLLVIICLNAEIIVKQDENGKITVTNKSSGYANQKKVSFKNKTYSQPIPYIYLLKIKRLAKKYQLREDLIISVVRAESSFNPYAISKKGAIGLMQLMPETARKYGVKNRFNVDDNLEAGIKHLKFLYSKFNQNLPLTLAAYNAGEEAIRSYKGIPPFRETRNYIKRAMKYMGFNYTNYLKPKPRKKLYKYTTKEGRIVITDSPPAKSKGTVEVLD